MFVVWTCIGVGVILAIWVGIAAWRARKPPFNPPVLTRMLTPAEQKLVDSLHLGRTPEEREQIEQMQQRIAEQKLRQAKR